MQNDKKTIENATNSFKNVKNQNFQKKNISRKNTN